MTHFESIQSKIERELQNGNTHAVNRFILEHCKGQKNLSRSEVYYLAELTKRTGDYYLGLKIFKSLIVEKFGGLKQLDEKERTLYATLQTRIGAPQKGIELLQEGSKKQAQTLFALATSHIYLWEYSKAIPLLEEYLEVEDPKSYQFAIGQTNLLASYGYTLFSEKIDALYQKCTENFEKNSWNLLLFNANEIMTGYHFNLQNYMQSEKFYRKAKETSFKGEASRYQLFLEKWEVALEGVSSKKVDEAIQKLVVLESRAKKMGLWNTIRELEYIRAHLIKDSNMMNSLYIGSPYNEYRSLIFKKNNWFSPKEFAFRKFGDFTGKRVFDINAACEQNEMVKVKPSSLDHKLLKYLNYDFYKVSLIGEIYYHLFPGQYFDPDSSLRRLYVGMQRFRKTLEFYQIPLELVIKNNCVQLLSLNSESYAFKVYPEVLNQEQSKSENEFSIYKALKARSRKSKVTNEDIQNILSLKRSAVTKFLRESSEKGWFKKEKCKKVVYYKFVA